MIVEPLDVCIRFESLADLGSSEIEFSLLLFVDLLLLLLLILLLMSSSMP